MQLNCWSGKLATQIKRFRDAENPDIVCLQEDYLTIERPGSIFASSNELFPSDSYPHRAFGKVQSYRFMHRLDDFGNTIISKYPIISSKVTFTRGNKPVEDTEIGDGSGSYNTRNFIHAKIDVNGQILHVLTHQGHHDPHSKDGSPENTRQMQRIADYVDALEGPVILTGDFNLHPKSTSLKPIHSRLNNLCTEYGIKNTRSILAKRKEVIDFVFVNKAIEVKDYWASDMIVSDHKALILDFNI